MTLFSQFKPIKPCSLCNPVDIKHKSCSFIIFPIKVPEQQRSQQTCAAPRVRGVEGFCMSVWVGISVGLLIDNLTPHKDSNSLKTNGYATVPLLPQHFRDKVHCLSRFLLYSRIPAHELFFCSVFS